jgi:fatty-acid desaturase
MLSRLYKDIVRAPEQATVARTQWVFMALTLTTLWFNPYVIYALCLGWFLGWFGGIMVAHRWYTHKYFTVKYKITEIVFHVIYNLTLIGSIVSYKYQHGLHHRYNEDVAGDPHTPLRTGFWKTTFGVYGAIWKHDKKLWLKLLRENALGRWFHEHYYTVPIVLGLVLLYVNVWYLLTFVSAVTISWQIIQLKIATLHWKIPGATKNFTCGGYNIWWLKPLLMGDESHNNHHYDGSKANANFCKDWKEFDPSYYVGRCLERLC